MIGLFKFPSCRVFASKQDKSVSIPRLPQRSFKSKHLFWQQRRLGFFTVLVQRFLLQICCKNPFCRTNWTAVRRRIASVKKPKGQKQKSGVEVGAFGCSYICHGRTFFYFYFEGLCCLFFFPCRLKRGKMTAAQQREPALVVAL